MRTMFGSAILLMAACFSDVACAEEVAVIRFIEKLGGKVKRNEAVPGRPVIGVVVARP